MLFPTFTQGLVCDHVVMQTKPEQPWPLIKDHHHDLRLWSGLLLLDLAHITTAWSTS